MSTLPSSPAPSSSSAGLGFIRTAPPDLLCALAMVLVGSTVVASKLIAGGLPPFSATALRFALALPFFLLLQRHSGMRIDWRAIGRHDACLLFLQAAAGSVGFTVLMMAGLARCAAGDAGVIAGSLPAVAALFGIVLLGERPSLRLGAAILLATAGVMAVSVLAKPAGLANTGAQGGFLGPLLVFAAVCCEALFILLNKKLRQPLPALPLSTLMCGGGLLIALPFALSEAEGLRATLQQPQTLLPALMGVVYYALVPTVMGFLLWYAGSAQLAGGRAGLYTALVPVSALSFAGLVLGDTISAAQMAGGLCVLAAVLLIAGPRQGHGSR